VQARPQGLEAVPLAEDLPQPEVWEAHVPRAREGQGRERRRDAGQAHLADPLGR
jgi:hypothetical protein